MNTSTWPQWIDSQLASIRAASRWRDTTTYDPTQWKSFAANDYLGLSTHPTVLAAAIDATRRFGTGATASRLVVGSRSIHDELEHAIAHWQGTERAIVFPSGYQANLAALTVFGADEATIFSDADNHASIIDGCRLAKSRVVVYRHNDVDHLSQLLRSCTTRKVVVTDLIFSMDGGMAPIDAIAALCTEHDALLIVDEAHAVMQSPTEVSCATLRVGTLSKSLASQGGWIAGSRAMVDLLINQARSFIFTTALAPASAAAALAALEIIRSAEGAERRAHLRRLIDVFIPQHPAPIIPFMLGDESSALRASMQLREHGILIPAIRPPTVAPGTSRLRIALSANHTLDEALHLQRMLNGCVANALTHRYAT